MNQEAVLAKGAEADREKHRVASASVLAAILLTVTKLIVGFSTNSLGILSEAAHSGLDLIAAGVTLWAVRISGRPADREHTYGHGKFENLSALFETLLLLATCVWIVYEGIQRLFVQEPGHVEASIWAFGVVVLSIVVDFSRSRALMRVARKYQSQALEADALHFSTDIWSSSVVLVGLVGVLAADVLGWPSLVRADAMAALGVALIVIWVSMRLGKKSIDDLLDAVPHGLQEKVEMAAVQVPGVQEVRQVRLRRSGPEMFADVTLSVGYATGFEEVHRIADRAEEAVRSVVPGADVVVHVEPVVGGEEDIATNIRALSARYGLGAHSVRVYDEAGQRSVELHLEVDESLSLEEAHRQATEFEQALREATPELVRIVTHLEPAGGDAKREVEPADEARIQEALHACFREHPQAAEAHDIRVQRVGDELSVSFHSTLDPSITIIDAHEFTQRLEADLRARLPDLGRVVIHVEPAQPGASGE